MLVRYRFVNETVEIEVSEEWGAVLAEQDRQEYNNQQKETRRHVSLDMVTQEQGMQFADGLQVEQQVDENLKRMILRAGLHQLAPKQRLLLRQVFSERLSVTSIARTEKVSEFAIRDRLARIYKKLKKSWG